MVQGLGFLSKKSWHTKNLANQEKVWIAEQRKEAEAQKTQELAKQIQQEREQEELDKIAGKVSTVKDRGIDWMYQGDSGQLAKEDAEKKTEEFLLGKEFQGAQATSEQTAGVFDEGDAQEGIHNVMSQATKPVELERKSVPQATTPAPMMAHGGPSVHDRNEEFRMRVEDPMFMVGQRQKERENKQQKNQDLYSRVVGYSDTKKSTKRHNDDDDEESSSRDDRKKRHRKSSKHDRKKKSHKRSRTSRDYHRKRSRRDRSRRSRSRSFSSSSERRYSSRSRSRSPSFRRYKQEGSRSNRKEDSYDRRPRQDTHRRDRREENHRRNSGEDRGYKNRNEPSCDVSSKEATPSVTKKYGLKNPNASSSNIDTRNLGPSKQLLEKKRDTDNVERRKNKEASSRRSRTTPEERARMLEQMQTDARQREEDKGDRLHQPKASHNNDDDGETKQAGGASFLTKITKETHGIGQDGASLASRIAQNRHTNQRNHDDFL